MGCVFRFFLLVTFFSVSEVAILLWVASNTGLMFTMACCVFTGILGGYLVKAQGLQTLNRIQVSINQGQLPADEAVEALMLLIVGILLCVPGFITDALGFLVIIPAVRKTVAGIVVKHISSMIASGKVHVFTPGARNSPEEYFRESKKPDAEEIENAEIIEESNLKGESDAEKKQI